MLKICKTQKRKTFDQEDCSTKVEEGAKEDNLPRKKIPKMNTQDAFDTPKSDKPEDKDPVLLECAPASFSPSLFSLFGILPRAKT